MAQSVSFFESRRQYVSQFVDPVVEDLVHDILTAMPADPVQFSLDWMRRRKGSMKPTAQISLQVQNTQLRSEFRRASATMADISEAIVTQGSTASSARRESVGSSSDSEDDDDDDVVEEMPVVTRPNHDKPRQSVSAEAFGQWNVMQSVALPVHSKTADQRNRLEHILSLSFLFSALEDQDLNAIISALQEKTFIDRERIIKEGDDGDCLFVVEHGSLECKKVIEGQERVVKTCAPGDVVGELALLYNCVRQASVDAAGTCVCWRLDRQTFNQVVKQGAAQRAEKYDKFLQSIGLFCSIEQAERSRIIECFKIARFKQGEAVVKQGDAGDRFYMVEEGDLAANKAIGQEEKTVKEYGPGEYFGELALLKNQPRAATVVVTSARAKLIWLDRKTFTKMLGPLQDILERRAATYA